MLLHLSWAQGAGDLSQQQPIELRIHLGNQGDDLRFFPDALQLETGKLYRLILLTQARRNITFPRMDYRSQYSLAKYRSMEKTARPRLK
jgi:hypothetical protein